MSQHKLLAKHAIGDEELDKLVALMRQRAQADESVSHPDAIYHSAAVDMAMGAVDLHEDIVQGMRSSHSAKQWLQILTGVEI